MTGIKAHGAADRELLVRRRTRIGWLLSACAVVGLMAAPAFAQQAPAASTGTQRDEIIVTGSSSTSLVDALRIKRKTDGVTDSEAASTSTSSTGAVTTAITPNMIVFINVFHVDPANQQRLVDILTQVTEEIVSKAAGFVSSTLHRSTDGAKVTMYARWRSLADYEVMRQDPAPRPFLEEALSIARFDPGMYEVVQEFSPPNP